MGYFYLHIGSSAGVIATSALKSSEEFTKFVPSLIVIVGYIVAFYFLALVLKTVPIGIAYAIWAGMGIVLVAIVGAVMFKQVPDLAALIGMTLIIAGVLIMHFFSKTISH